MRRLPTESSNRWWSDLWTGRQRRVLAWVIVAILGVVLIRQLQRPAFVPDPLPTQGARAGELWNKLDPNKAPLAYLSVLPGIGDRRAAAIVAYREQFERTHERRIPFLRAEDLADVEGIGLATVENIRPYLIFPSPDVP